MKITFPHLGDAHILIRLLCKEMNVDCIVPPLNTLETLERGSRFSPEEICLPFKLMVGNIMAGIDNGADTVVMVSSNGPCRLGEYGELLKSVLDKNGYQADWILLDTVRDIGIRELIRRAGFVWGGKKRSKLKLLKALKGIYKVVHSLEKMEKEIHIRCGYETEKGKLKDMLYKCKRDICRCDTIKEAVKIIEQSSGKVKRIPIDRSRNPAKVMLTGEIFSLIDPFGNQYLEDKLMDMGVSFSKRITIGWWIDTTFVHSLKRAKMMKQSNGFLNYCIGGYAKDTVEEVIEAKKNHYDGVIQLLPLGCMPEIVVKSIIPEMSDELDIKILTIVFDEMNGEAGYITRIEAFIDMLQRRKQHVLYGY